MSGRRLGIGLLIAALVSLSIGVYGGNSDTITVNYEVQAINEIVISAASVTLTVSTATAGSQPDSATDNSTATYALTTNSTTADSKKITAAIDTAMPSGVTLYLTLAAPTGATSAGETEITNVAASVVTAIEAVAESGLVMTFKLSATVSAGVVASASKTLTLTLTDVS